METCLRAFLILLTILSISVSIVQVGFGIYYVQHPVDCDRSGFLTILTLSGGCSGILSVMFLSCLCYRSGFGLQSSNPARNRRRIYY